MFKKWGMRKRIFKEGSANGTNFYSNLKYFYTRKVCAIVKNIFVVAAAVKTLEKEKKNE